MNTETSPLSPRRLTLRDVALRAGVNQASVSVVLNGAKSSAGVSEAKRARILHAAEELGYRRNASAANMKSERSGWITMLQANAGDMAVFHNGLIQGVNSELSNHKLHLHLESVEVETMYDEAMWPTVLREWVSDGIIIIFDKMNVPELERVIQRQRIPVIWTNARRESDCVFPDDEGAFYAMTGELLRLGHRRIYYMDGGHPSHYSTYDRRAGYEKAMLQAGLAPEVSGEISNNHHERYDFIRSVVLRPAHLRPTAIVCYRRPDALIFGLAARTLGIRIPEELSLVAPGNEHRAEQIEGKQLSTMVIPFTEVGRSAVRLLLQKLEAPHIGLPPHAVPFKVLAGETHAAVNS